MYEKTGGIPEEHALNVFRNISHGQEAGLRIFLFGFFLERHVIQVLD